MRHLVLVTTVLLLSSCKYKTTFNGIKNLESSKSKVEEISTMDLNPENHSVLKKYFSSIKNLSYEFMNNSKMRKYTHKKFKKFFDNSICEKIILNETVYQNVMEKCSVNGFYICSEEVADYKKMLVSVKNLLKDNEVKMIVENKTCKSTLIDLGVINE